MSGSWKHLGWKGGEVVIRSFMGVDLWNSMSPSFELTIRSYISHTSQNFTQQKPLRRTRRYLSKRLRDSRAD